MIPFKQWRFEEAARLGITVAGLGHRLYRSSKPYYKHLKIKRVNRRVIFVLNVNKL